jgi:hypothetical protein
MQPPNTTDAAAFSASTEVLRSHSSQAGNCLGFAKRTMGDAPRAGIGDSVQRTGRKAAGDLYADAVLSSSPHFSFSQLQQPECCTQEHVEAASLKMASPPCCVGAAGPLNLHRMAREGVPCGFRHGCSSPAALRKSWNLGAGLLSLRASCTRHGRAHSARSRLLQEAPSIAPTIGDNGSTGGAQRGERRRLTNLPLIQWARKADVIWSASRSGCARMQIGAPRRQ